MRQKSATLLQTIKTYINTYSKRHGAPPSIRTISSGTGASRATVHRYLIALGESGEIAYENGCIETPFCEKANTIAVPLLGDVACGLPTYEEEYIEAYYSLPCALVGSEACYLLRARGNSMIEAGIENGDLVLIRQQSFALPGQIAVVLVEDEVTLKRYYPEPANKRYRLHPENKNMPDIYVTDAIIQGVAIKVIKDLT